MFHGFMPGGLRNLDYLFLQLKLQLKVWMEKNIIAFYSFTRILVAPVVPPPCSFETRELATLVNTDHYSITHISVNNWLLTDRILVSIPHYSCVTHRQKQ